jgi:hypothetical protein
MWKVVVQGSSSELANRSDLLELGDCRYERLSSRAIEVDDELELLPSTLTAQHDASSESTMADPISRPPTNPCAIRNRRLDL